MFARIQDTEERLVGMIGSILEEMDIDYTDSKKPAGPTPPSPGPSGKCRKRNKSHKSGKANTEDDLFTRRLSLSSIVDDVGAVKNKVHSIENKVHSIENKVNNLEEMMAQIIELVTPDQGRD